MCSCPVAVVSWQVVPVLVGDDQERVLHEAMRIGQVRRALLHYVAMKQQLGWLIGSRLDRLSVNEDWSCISAMAAAT